MKAACWWLVSTTLSSLAFALDIAARSPYPRVVGLDIERRHVPNIIDRERRRLLKRQKVVEETLDNEESLYFANITLGTPPQNLRMHLDTGSSDLWVNVANSTLCRSSKQPCIGGTFNPTTSTTNKVTDSVFNISYVDGSTARGSYVTDTMGIGGVTLNDLQFGVGTTSSSRQNILGIGYGGNEALAVNTGEQYANLPQALLNGGFINRNAYSLWLNDLDASTGTILFGGVNKAKYTGDLTTIPVFRTSRRGYGAFVVAMTGVGLNGSAISSSNLPSPVVLDSGSTISRLPDDITQVIFDRLNVTYDSADGVGLAPCNLGNTAAYLEFSFSGINIQVPFRELFLDAGPDDDGQPLTYDDGTLACLFGIAPASGIVPILGDTFLRSAYAVFDLERNEVSLAQTVYNSTGNDVREIAAALTVPIPGATDAATTITSLAFGTATNTAGLGPATGSFTAIVSVNPSMVGTALSTIATSVLSSASASASASSSSKSSSSNNGAYPTKAPYLVGAAMMAAGGMLL